VLSVRVSLLRDALMPFSLTWEVLAVKMLGVDPAAPRAASRKALHFLGNVTVLERSAAAQRLQSTPGKFVCIPDLPYGRDMSIYPLAAHC
jgi:hypothetical protein